MKDLSPTAQEVLRQMAAGGEWTFWPCDGWLVRIFGKLVDLGFAEELFDMTSKQWDGRMWRVTEEGRLKARSIPTIVPRLRRPVSLWNGQ